MHGDEKKGARKGCQLDRNETMGRKRCLVVRWRKKNAHRETHEGRKVNRYRSGEKEEKYCMGLKEEGWLANGERKQCR